MRPVRLSLAIFVACSASSETPRKPPSDAARHTLAEADLAPVFDAIGDRIAADLRTATAHPPRSKVGAAEILAAATPVGFYRYADELARFDITAPEVAGFASANPDAMERLAQSMTAHFSDALTAFEQVLATLPAGDADDCRAVRERVQALAQATGPERQLLPVLAPALASGCAPH